MRAHTTLLALALVLAGTTHALAQSGAAIDTLTRLTQIDQEIAGALTDVEQAEAGGARIEAELGGIGDVHASSARRVTEHTRALYRLSRAGALPLAGGFEALLGHAARVERLTRMLERDVIETQSVVRREAA